MNPAMMNPDMMKAAQKMMANMSPEDMNRMMEMSKGMNPNMMQQAQQMMSNPAMAKQAAAAMENMSGDEMRSRLDAVSNGTAPGLPRPAPAPAAQTVVEKLRGSPMDVPADVIEAVEEAEGLKAIGNKKFKEADFAGAAGRYEQGTKRLAGVSGLGGADKKAVAELKEACHLNLANCRFKLGEYEAAITECATVLERGVNRKALFRRGVALQKLQRLEEARADLKKAVEMDPADSSVVASLTEVEKAMKVEPTKVVVPPPAPAPAPVMAPPGMPSDPAQMEKMIDQITPEQMKQQAEMLENMDPAALGSMAPQLGGMSAEQLKMVSGMMKNMDPAQMKSMAKMAQSMQASGMTMPGATSGAPGASQAAPGEIPDMSNMSMDKGMEMMENPEMMKAGIEMMKNMDPKAMASMSKAMGREISEDQMAQMQSMMDKMSPEDVEKWSNRASKAASWIKKPVKAYQVCKEKGQRLGASGALAIVTGILAVLAVGHFTDSF